VRSYPFGYRLVLGDLPPTAAMAFRFHQGHKLLLVCNGQVYEGDLVEPARWHHLPYGTQVFVRLPGSLEGAPIVKASIMENHLHHPDPLPDGSNCVLELDLFPDRPDSIAEEEEELVALQYGQMQTIFLFWPRLPKAIFRRDA
jgi:hypothetical protein